MKGTVVAISGIDTGVGKTVVTGLLGKALLQAGKTVITQKIVQTGCEGIATDIEEHRRLMGIALQEVDHAGLTAPYLFRYPASPHLAAHLEQVLFDVLHVRRATFALQKKYEIVLLEGVGGLLVPLAPDLLFADYIAQAGYSLVLVTTPRLGSINHTLLSIEAIVKRSIPLKAVIYNLFGDVDELIANDTREVIRMFLHNAGMHCPIIELRNGALDVEAIPLFL